MRRGWCVVLSAALVVGACGADDSADQPSPTTGSTTTTDEPAGDTFTPEADTRVTLPDAAATSTTAPPTTTTTTTTTTTLPPTTTTRPPATTTLPPTTTTRPPATTTTTTSSTTTSPPTTASVPTTTAASTTAPVELATNEVFVGTSVEGRPIIAERHGTEGGRRVLVIGVIHGNEDAGVAVVDELRTRSIDGAVPDTVELWLIESMNPDGQAVQDRRNANLVDLNRNFPYEWGPIGRPGDSQFAGIGPASEPETKAMVAFIELLRPDIAIWYHQDANLIIPSTGRQGRIRARYAELTGLPLAECCSGGGIYTGIAATWARVTLSDQEAVPFIVELPGGDLTPEQVAAHTDAVLTVAAEG